MAYGVLNDGPKERYLKVDVRHTIDGMIIPLRIYWSDARIFEIAECHFDGVDSRIGARRWAVRIKSHKAFT